MASLGCVSSRERGSSCTYLETGPSTEDLSHPQFSAVSLVSKMRLPSPDPKGRALKSSTKLPAQGLSVQVAVLQAYLLVSFALPPQVPPCEEAEPQPFSPSGPFILCLPPMNTDCLVIRAHPCFPVTFLLFVLTWVKPADSSSLPLYLLTPLPDSAFLLSCFSGSLLMSLPVFPGNPVYPKSLTGGNSRHASPVLHPLHVPRHSSKR